MLGVKASGYDNTENRFSINVIIYPDIPPKECTADLELRPILKF